MIGVKRKGGAPAGEGLDSSDAVGRGTPAHGVSRVSGRALVAGCLALGLALGLGGGWLAWPRLATQTFTQPIRFSHSVHARQEVPCAVCHFTAPGGAFGGLPPVAVCAGCHQDPTGGRSDDAKEADKFVTEYVKKRKEVPWLVLAAQPDHVRFPHGPHLKAACAICHPDMSREDYPTLRRDRISGYTNWTMSMQRCRACHQASGAGQDCVLCHR